MKEPLHDKWEIGELDCWDQLARETLIMVGAASNDNLIALFALDFCTQEAYVSDVMLRTGVWAAGDVQVDRLLNLEAFVEQACERNSMRFRIGGSITAASVSGARDRSTEHATCGEVEPDSQYCLLRGIEVLLRDVGNHEVLPHRQPNLAAAEAVCNIGGGKHL